MYVPYIYSHKYLSQSLAHLRCGFLHGCLLNEGTGQFCVLSTDLMGSLLSKGLELFSLGLGERERERERERYTFYIICTQVNYSQKWKFIHSLVTPPILHTCVLDVHTIHWQFITTCTCTILAHPECVSEGSLEVSADAKQQRFPACDEGHTSCEVADHVVGSKVHTMDVRV